MLLSPKQCEMLKANAFKILEANQAADSSKSSKKSSKAQKIEKALARMHFSYPEDGKALATIFSQIVGEEINYESKVSKETPEVGSIIVVLNNTNSHNYPVNQPLLYLGVRPGLQFSAMKCDGKVGNNLQVGAKGNYGYTWRYGTSNEIEDYFKSLDSLWDPKGPSSAEDLIKVIY